MSKRQRTRPTKDWQLYVECGLQGGHVVAWLYDEHLTLEFADEPLAANKVTYALGGAQLAKVAEPHLYEPPHRSPQEFLWEHADRVWLKVVRVPAYAPRKRQVTHGVQRRLFTEEEHA
jgi:hypothetical protein